MRSELAAEKCGRVLKASELPTLPQVLYEAMELLDSPDTGTEDIARVIERDQVLSAKILKMINSPIYGFPGRIGSINHALVLLGFGVIRGIIISTSVFDVMNSNMTGLWNHSIAAALASKIIAQEAGFKDVEEFAVSGLLHDLGKVVAAAQHPDVKQEIDSFVQDYDESYLTAERAVMGLSHYKINYWLAEHWKLPLTIKEGITYHHMPSKAKHYNAFASVVHTADFVVRVCELGNGGDEHASRLDPEALSILKLESQDIPPIMERLLEEFVEIADYTP
jgi:HD-like signal output (HDOD) protein